jgi:membrane protease YdiL (CAAX protease family)
MRSYVKRHPLLLYLVLTFAWFWSSIALNYTKQFRFWSLMVGALAPTICSVTVIGISEGEDAVRGLVRRLWKWQVGWKWYPIALGLPVAEGLFAVGVASAFGVFKLARINLDMLRTTLPAFWIVFLFAAGEELGWRGYALPRLLTRHNAVLASFILGMIHAVWHWPLFLPHSYLSDIPIIPWTVSIAAEAIVFTWIYRNTGGSVLLAALFHGMQNLVQTLFDGIDPLWMPRYRSAIDVVVAIIIVFVAGTELMRRARGTDIALS